MALTAGECGLTLVEDYLRLTLADCARFRTWTQAANQEQALARIFIDDLPRPPNYRDAYTPAELIALRPFAIVTTAKQGGYSKGRVGAVRTYAEAGSLSILFEENVKAAEANDVAQLERAFKNTLGVILDEMLALAYGAGYLAIDLISFHGPLRCNQDDIPGEGDHHFAFFDVKHGVGLV